MVFLIEVNVDESPIQLAEWLHELSRTLHTKTLLKGEVIEHVLVGSERLKGLKGRLLYSTDRLRLIETLKRCGQDS